MKQKSEYPEIKLDLSAIDLAKKQVETLISYVHQHTTTPLNQLLLLDQRSFQIDTKQNIYWFYIQSKIDNKIYGMTATYDPTEKTFSEVNINTL